MYEVIGRVSHESLDEVSNRSTETILPRGACLQEAIARLPMEGGVIRLGAYDYYVSSAISLTRDNVSIIGNGRSRIKHSGSAGTIFRVVANGFRLERVRLFGTGSTAYALSLAGNNMYIKDVAFEDVGACVTGSNCESLVIEGCRSDTVDPVNYLINLSNCDRATVIGNNLYDSTTRSVVIYATDTSGHGTYVGNIGNGDISYKGSMNNANAGNAGMGVVVR